MVFQSKAQLNQWGQDDAETMWDAAVARVILPGGANDKELQSLSNLIGEMQIERESHTLGQGPASVQVSSERKAIITPKQIREMQKGHALIFYRPLKPVIAKLSPFNENPAFGRCVADQKALNAEVREHSTFAADIARFQQKRADE